MRTLRDRVSRHPLLGAAVCVLIVQALFTIAVRTVLVPRLLAESHWQYGLQRSGDSAFFHQEAIKIAADARSGGAGRLSREASEGLAHAQIIAAIYYAVGSDNPWAVYLVNAVLASLSVLLLAQIGVLAGVPRHLSALLALLFGCSPLFLFLHSELLREPFFLPAMLMSWLGALSLVFPEYLSGTRRLATVIAAAVALVLGFLISTAFRAYLLWPLLAAFVLMFILATIWRLLVDRSSGRWPLTHATLLAALAGITVIVVYPRMNRVQQYADRGAPIQVQQSVATMAAEPEQQLKRILESPTERLPREAITGVPHVCTIRWQPSGRLPDRVERALEALACARQEYQRACDPAIMGKYADRNCDMVALSSAADVIGHVPWAMVFSLFTPFPNVWVEGFGAGGTGLRRAGYVLDGAVSYALLPGLFGLLWRKPGAPNGVPLLIVAIGVGLVILVYGFAVPTQFILARMRLGFYLPLLMLAAAGWCRIVSRKNPTIPPVL